MGFPIPVQPAGTYRGIDIQWLPFMNRYRFYYEGEEYISTSLKEAKSLIDVLVEPEFPPIPEIPEEEEVIEEPPEIPEIPEIPEEPLDEIPIEPPTIIVPEPYEVPSLPWYAAWLKPILEWIGTLTESVSNFFAPIFRGIGNVSDNVLNLPVRLINGFINNMTKIISSGSLRGGELASKTLSDVAAGSPPWMTNIQETLDGMIGSLVSQYNEALDIETYEKSPLAGEEAVTALGELKNKLVATSIINFIIHALVESGSLGQYEFMRDLDQIVTSKFGLYELISKSTLLPIEKAILIPAEQEWFTRHPNLIPTYTDLINMVVKEVITLDEFKANMLKLGFKPEWSQFIWDAHFRPPDWTQLLNAYYRRKITREELETLKILVDLDPRYNKIWDAQIEQIPPYSELVNERRKEVIDAATFEKYLQWYGFDKVWADRIWDAHFIPPSLGDILTAWRRKLIDEDKVDELMILVDLDPRFKDIFDTRKYVDPSVTMARYMFETQAVDEEGVKDIVARAGYLPQDIDAITNFIVRFQERRYRTRYLTSLLTGIVAGAYTPEELTAEVVAAGYTEQVAEWMIKTAGVRRRIVETKITPTKPKLVNLGDLKKAYLRDEITEDVFRTDLSIRGYPIDEVDLLVRLINGDKVTEEAGKRKIALSQSELLNAWRYEEATEDQVRTTLQLRGLATDEVEMLIKTKKKQWGMIE